MISFNDDKQDKFISAIRGKEEEDLIKTLASQKYSLPYIDLAKIMIENEALTVVSEETSRKLLLAPFEVKGRYISIGVHSPEHDGMEEFKKMMSDKGYKISWFMVSQTGLDKVWNRYKEISLAKKVKSGSLDIQESTIKEIIDSIKTIQDVKVLIDRASEEVKTHRITRILEIVFGGAISLGISDVHIEPEEGSVRLRFRLDGVMHTILFFDNKTYDMLVSRIKLLSGLKLVKGKNQDGRFSIWLEGAEVSMRTSIMPGAYGDSVVMRILNPKSIEVDLEDLGIEDKLFKKISREIKKPNGLIVITGPTGSGKTTTLYSFLRRIKTTENKVITIEDPIEYHLPGITQTQTNEKKDYTFAQGLRSALRHDPDVIMVGEIRDPETATIAVESSLTGHMVFSTLHTNNAPGAIPRFIDLKVNPKILTSALSMAIAQRLIRKICPHCKKERDLEEEENRIITNILKRAKEDGKDIEAYGINSLENLKLYEAQGCVECNGVGYKGRIGIFEAVLSDDSVQELIPKNPSEHDIRMVAKKQGILDMKEDGIIKSLKGLTSFSEVKSVVDVYEDDED